MAPTMDTRSHCFVSEKGGLLTRWREAFPSAEAIGCNDVTRRGATAELVWLHLTNGTDLAKQFEQVRDVLGDVPTVALSDQPDDDEAMVCFSLGVRGYCNTHAQPALLRSVAQVVLQGGLWIGEALMGRLLRATSGAASQSDTPPDWSGLLTERERQVALAVAGGASNKEIARQFEITERTVKAHTGAIFQKLGVRDRLQLSLRVHGRPPH
jgi:DNA-binding NarL/FixJ family response regulator